jgi:hypothetical protein
MNNLTTKTKYWHELTEEEKKAIHNPDNYPIISIIKGIPRETKEKIYHELCDVPSLVKKKYEHEQIKWLNDAGQYLWENEFHKDKTIDVQKTGLFVNEILHSPIRIEYRLYYVAKNPRVINGIEASKELADFLYDVYKITGGRFGARVNSLLKSA